MMLGIAIAKIIASEKSMTGPRLAEAPMTTNRQKMILKISSLVWPSPKRKVQAFSP